MTKSISGRGLKSCQMCKDFKDQSRKTVLEKQIIRMHGKDIENYLRLNIFTSQPTMNLNVTASCWMAW